MIADGLDHHRTCQHKAYRMSCEDLDGLLEFAGRCCQICQVAESETQRRRLVIDHDYRYGFMAVRGLLCDRCNALMRRVDAGEARPTDAVYNYLHSAWFVRVVEGRRVAGLSARSQRRYSSRRLVI